jgi:L-amino acid N-acyltransferase YncA
MSDVTVEPLLSEHWDAVARIYAEGIATGNATFETDVPEWEAWHQGHLETLRLVDLRDGHVVGWAALSPVSERCVYAGVAEEPVFVTAEARGRGIGHALLEELIERSEQAGIWTIQTGTSPRTRSVSACTSGSASA